MQIQISTEDITNFEGDVIVLPCDCELTHKKMGQKGILKAVRIGLRRDRRYRKEDIMKMANSSSRD